MDGRTDADGWSDMQKVRLITATHEIVIAPLAFTPNFTPFTGKDVMNF